MYLFRAANVWWRCAHHFVDRCPETIDVCISRMFVFMSAVGTVWSSMGMFLCSGRC